LPIACLQAPASPHHTYVLSFRSRSLTFNAATTPSPAQPPHSQRQHQLQPRNPTSSHLRLVRHTCVHSDGIHGSCAVGRRVRVPCCPVSFRVEAPVGSRGGWERTLFCLYPAKRANRKVWCSKCSVGEQKKTLCALRGGSVICRIGRLARTKYRSSVGNGLALRFAGNLSNTRQLHPQYNQYFGFRTFTVTDLVVQPLTSVIGDQHSDDQREIHTMTPIRG
jgi:hypothetical protein